MIYRNDRIYPITLLNESTGKTYIIHPGQLTPDIPEYVAADYTNILTPLFVAPIPQNIAAKVISEGLYETESVNDLFELESESIEGNLEDVQVLNEVKKGRGRPKKIL